MKKVVIIFGNNDIFYYLYIKKKEQELRGQQQKVGDKTMTTVEMYKQVYNTGKAAANDSDYFRCYYTAIFTKVFDMGYKGVEIDFDNIVDGFRYGDVPNGGVSYNYREDEFENGCSLAAINGHEAVSSEIWFCDREKVEVKGILLSETGSDGEPLVLPLGIEQYDF